MENVMVLTGTWFVCSDRTDRKTSSLGRIIVIGLPTFLPQCGKFYCHRENCRGDVGVSGTFAAHNMSWLRLQRTETHGSCEVSYSCGADSFVKRFDLSLRVMVFIMKMAVLVSNTLKRTIAC
jgi:hypothetical protein